MVTLADGSAATASRDPQRAAEAMRSVAETGRSALGEMRRMLGVLREPGGSPAELAPQPGLSAIPELIDGFREAGMPVRLTTSGVPEADPAVALAVYRLVQEGLTNALRHGRNAQHVEVRLQHRPGEVEVLVEDDAPDDDPELLGLYEGVPLTERDHMWAAGALPDRITIFRNPTLAICETREDVVEEVAVTVVHEIAHHFGIDDDRLHELGWG